MIKIACTEPRLPTGTKKSQKPACWVSKVLPDPANPFDRAVVVRVALGGHAVRVLEDHHRRRCVNRIPTGLVSQCRPHPQSLKYVGDFLRQEGVASRQAVSTDGPSARATSLPDLGDRDGSPHLMMNYHTLNRRKVYVDVARPALSSAHEHHALRLDRRSGHHRCGL